MLLASLTLAACSTAPKQPVFYPNPHLQQVGAAQSQRDIDACRQLAVDSGVSPNKDGQVGQKAAKGAVLGGVGSAAWGLVRGGDAAERALAGAAAGAATGAAAGGFSSAEINPTYQRFVERCLRERGYDVIGWE
jgi:uncharacterized protein YcfJ